MKVSWHDYSQYMEKKCSKPPTSLSPHACWFSQPINPAIRPETVLDAACRPGRPAVFACEGQLFLAKSFWGVKKRKDVRNG